MKKKKRRRDDLIRRRASEEPQKSEKPHRTVEITGNARIARDGSRYLLITAARLHAAHHGREETLHALALAAESLTDIEEEPGE